MNIRYIIIAVLISVISVILALIQYYQSNYQKLTAVKLYDPLFKDLIPSNLGYYNLLHKLDYLKTLQVIDTYKKVHKGNKKLYSTESEIDNCLKAALAYKLSGKNDKALKLFQHAAAIAPENADVLNRYGEYLEQAHEDVISADELYFKALVYSPDHVAALSNRRRTSGLVDHLDLQMFKSIDENKERLKEYLDVHKDFETMKLIYYLHIYHSVGIEGNTLSVKELIYLLETGKTIADKSIAEHNEILGLELAMRYLKSLASVEIIEITDILEMHKRVMGHVDPLLAGVFRDEQVFVGSHVPPPPERIPILMATYVDWLNSDEAHNMHPVRYAALAHYKLVDIHPFADGNGRTSRLIMNLILLRAGYPPVIIYKEDRQKYYNYLKLANKGDVRPFVRFIAYCTDETINAYLGRNPKLHQIAHKPISVIEIESNNDIVQ